MASISSRSANDSCTDAEKVSVKVISYEDMIYLPRESLPVLGFIASVLCRR